MAVNSFFLILTSLGSTMINLIAGLILIRALAPEQYGMYVYFMKIFGLARIVGTLGLGAAIIDGVSRESTLNNQLGLAKSLYTLLGLRLLSAGSALLVLSVISWLQRDEIYFWAGLAALIASLSDYLSSIAKGLRHQRVVALATILQPIVFIAFIIGLFIMGFLYPRGIYAVFTISFIFIVLVYFLALHREHLPRPGISAFSVSYLRISLSTIVDLFVYTVLSTFYLGLGTFLLGYKDEFANAAFLNAAFLPVSITGGTGFVLISSVFYPELVIHLAKNDRVSANQLLNLFVKGSLFVLIVPISALLIHAAVFTRLIYTDTYLPSVLPMQVLSPLMAIYWLQQILFFVLFASNKSAVGRKAILIQTAVLMIGILASLTFLEEYLISSIALSYTLSGIIGFLIMWLVVQKSFQITLRVSRISGIILLSLFIMLLASSIFTLFGVSEIARVTLAIILASPFVIVATMWLLLSDQEKSLLHSWASGYFQSRHAALSRDEGRSNKPWS